ncbi:MAG: hypothetical protein ACD_5C00253G0005 [uncultured bacterium]|nr:MAG: hypothetical protein ACD_5C00253G0005 [uncultured bacterium]
MNEKETFGIIAEENSIQQAVKSLNENGIEAFIAERGDEAKQMVLDMIPDNAEVMTMTSVTLDTLGISREINEGERYNSVRQKLTSMSKESQGNEMQKMGAAPDWVIGSVHAVTEDGKVIIASATGSQLPAYMYGSNHVIWVVGTQKIVENLSEGMRRIQEYTFPLENERAMKAYGVGSGINKIVTINKEVIPGRIKMIIVKEKLGF